MPDTISLQASLSALLGRDLQAMRRTIEAYPDDLLPWLPHPSMPNSGGTLALHVTGNLRSYIGAALGGTGYVRDRPREFAARDLPRSVVAEGLEAAEREVRATLAGLSDADLQRQFPQPLSGQHFLTGDLLLHLAVHLGYHLGQADYHRRLVTGNSVAIGAMALPALASAQPAGE